MPGTWPFILSPRDAVEPVPIKSAAGKADTIGINRSRVTGPAMTRPDTIRPPRGRQPVPLAALDQSDPVGTDVIDQSLDTISSLYEYNHWIYSLIRPYTRGRVLEVGCGKGNITQFLSMNATEVVGVDPVHRFVWDCRKRFRHMSHVSAKVGYLHDLSLPVQAAQLFDTVVSCNVLEHIQDDVEAVAMMARQLRVGGRVVIFVPAGPWAFGRLDRQLGHYRRYTVSSLRRVFLQAGLQWVKGTYSNSVGLLGWWLNSVVLRRRQVPEQQAAWFNRFVPLLSALERITPLPLGQSVMGVAMKVPSQARAATPVVAECSSARAA